MTELSHAAQEVFWAFNSKFSWIEDGVPGPQFKAIAAALRAVDGELASCLFVGPDEGDIKRVIDVSDLHDLIDELEAL
jgi:hypothetical protein